MTQAQLVRELFDRAIKLTWGERDAFLVEQCAGEPSILDECRQLLIAYEAVIEGDQLTSSGPPHRSNSPESSALAPILTPGRIFGHYRIVRVIGRGGMGEVYEAEYLRHGRRI